MTVTVLDSNDLPGILADAGIEIEAPEKPTEAAGDAPANGDGKGATAADAPEDRDDVEGDDGLTPRQKREFTQTMQKTIGKKHRQMKEAEEFAASQYGERKLAEQRAADLERQLAELKGKHAPEPKAPTPPAKPTRDAFATEGEYLDAMIQYGVDERLRQKADDEAKAAEQQRQESLVETAKGRITRALELVPDYADVTGAIDLEVPPVVAGYMQKSELFAELGYHLAKNPDLLVSLAKLPPDEQLVKIGRIEGTLSPFGSESAQHDHASSKEAPNGRAKPAPSEPTGEPLSKPRGKAAPVITPLEAAGSAGARKDPADMNIREAIEDYSKRNRINLGMRKRH